MLLSEYHADLESTDDEGRTALLWAAACGHTGTAQMLLRRRASLETTTRAGYTPLCRAAANGHAATCEMLLRQGAVVSGAPAGAEGCGGDAQADLPPALPSSDPLSLAFSVCLPP